MSVALVGPTLAMSGNGQGLIATVGKAIPLVFLIGLVGVSLVGYSFVRLTRHLNHAGSAYGLVGGTIGPRAGFFSGFAMLGAYVGVRDRHPGADRGVRQRVHRRNCNRATTTRTRCRGWLVVVVGAVDLVPAVRSRHPAARQDPARDRGRRHPCR